MKGNISHNNKYKALLVCLQIRNNRYKLAWNVKFVQFLYSCKLQNSSLSQLQICVCHTTHVDQKIN